jgi:hypothetical protein
VQKLPSHNPKSCEYVLDLAPHDTPPNAASHTAQIVSYLNKSNTRAINLSDKSGLYARDSTLSATVILTVIIDETLMKIMVIQSHFPLFKEHA